MFCTRVAWACLVCLLLCREEGFSPVSLRLLRGGIWACIRFPCLYLFWGFWNRDYVSQLPCVRYYVLVRSSLNILVSNASPRGYMCFRWLIFTLSGPCALLFFICFFASWTWEVVSVMLYPCMLCVALSMDLFVLCVACLTVFVNCLVKQFAICLGVFVILLLNVMELLSVVGGALLDRPCMVFRIMCVLCLWSQWSSRCSFHMFGLCFILYSRKLSPHFGVSELGHRCLLLLCCFFVWFCILCIRVRACNYMHISLWYFVLVYH